MHGASLELKWKFSDCRFPSLPVDMVALITAALLKASRYWLHWIILPWLSSGKVSNVYVEYCSILLGIGVTLSDPHIVGYLCVHCQFVYPVCLFSARGLRLSPGCFFSRDQIILCTIPNISQGRCIFSPNFHMHVITSLNTSSH